MTPIGDLSKQDKKHLKTLAQSHNRIIEGGVGASTQILTHYTAGKVVSYDTDPKWIERIRDVVFTKVKVKGDCEFRLYEGTVEGRFDLAFVDIEWSKRLEFAIKAWRLIVPGGKLVFHDARREKDIANVVAFLSERYAEVESVDICPDDTNFAIFTKRDKRCDYVDWHEVEKLTPKQLGVDWL